MSIRDEAIHLLDTALQECPSDYCHPDEHGGYDTDSADAARVVVDTLLADPVLLRALCEHAEWTAGTIRA